MKWVKFSEQKPELNKYYFMKFGDQPYQRTFCLYHTGGHYNSMTEWLDETPEQIHELDMNLINQFGPPEQK